MSETMPFEKALEKLEKIVRDLESGDIGLDESLKKYEEGVRLSRQCQDKLEQAEKKIEILTRSLEGDVEKKPFEPDEQNETPSKPRGAARARKDEAEEGDFLL